MGKMCIDSMHMVKQVQHRLGTKVSAIYEHEGALTWMAFGEFYQDHVTNRPLSIRELKKRGIDEPTNIGICRRSLEGDVEHVATKYLEQMDSQKSKKNRD